MKFTKSDTNPSSPDPSNTSHGSASPDPFETQLRSSLVLLADHAPTAPEFSVEYGLGTEYSDGTITTNDMPPRRARRVASVGAVVAILMGGAGLTLAGLQGASDDGGAATPDEAVQQFATALSNEDVLGMADMTVPEEAKAIRAAARDGVAEAQRLDLLGDAFKLNGVSGVDLQIERLALADAPISDDLVVVTATSGTATLKLDANAAELGEQFRLANAGRLGSDDVGTSDPRDLTGALLVTQRRGDRWYVSIGMSLAQYMVAESANDPALQATTGTDAIVLPFGSSSPETAATELYARLSKLDLAGAAAMSAPGEGDALRVYNALLKRYVETSIAPSMADGLAFTITTPIEFQRVSESSGRVVLKPSTYGFDITYPEYKYEQVSLADPGFPTRVQSTSKNGTYILPAGQAVPARIDDPVFATAEFISNDDATKLAELDSISAAYNPAWENPSGEIEQTTESQRAGLLGTSTVHVEVGDGCTTLRLPDSAFNSATIDGPYHADYMAGFGFEQVSDHEFRQCGPGQSAFSTVMGAFAWGSNQLPQLPSIVVTETAGEWFVSPIGTLGEAITSSMRDVPDGANIIDIPLMATMSGLASRDQINAALVSEISTWEPASATVGADGSTWEKMKPECGPVIEAGPNGAPVVVADPDITALRRCLGKGLDTADSATAESGDASLADLSGTELEASSGTGG